MTDSKENMKIVVSENGPYIVSGNIPLAIQTITPTRKAFHGTGTKGNLSIQNQSTSFVGAGVRRISRSVMEPMRKSDSTEKRPQPASHL